MAAITWRNVDGPSLADAARPLAYARDTFTGGLDALGNAIKGYEAGQERMFKKQDDAATQDILGQIYQAGSVADFNRLNTSGALDQAVAANGARIDRAAVNALRDGRVGVLQGREKQGWEFQDATTDRAQLPVVQEILTLASAGQKNAALAKMAENPNLRMPAALMDSIVKGDREFQRWGFTVAEEKQKEVMRPLDVQAKKADITGKNLGNATASLNLDTARMDAADKKEVRQLENAIAAKAAEHSASREVSGRAQGDLATRLGLPVDSRGFADLSNYNSEQLKTFDQSARLTGVPLSKDALAGDTIRADSFYQQLTNSGKFSPRVLKAGETAIRSAFNTPVGERGLVGNDAFNAKLTKAMNEVGFDREDASNWYAPNSADARRSYEELAQKLPDIVKAMPAGTWFGDNQKDIPDLQKVLGEIASTGIRRNDGTYVTPSANDVMRFIRSQEGGFRDAKRGEDVKAELTKWINSPEAIEMQRKGLESQKWRDKQRVRDLTYGDLVDPKKK